MNQTVSQFSTSGAGLTFTPLLTPNLVFFLCFLFFFLLHLLLLFLHFRWYGYGIGMVCGLLLEFLGYIAKIQLHRNRENSSAYILYIIGLTLGPVFLSSSLYLGISTLQRRYQIQVLHLSPTLFATLFIFGDFICLCFIGVGGSLAAIFSPQPIGPDLMVVGLAIQVFFTTLFCFLLLIIIKKSFSIVINEKRTVYIWLSFFAALCLLVRSGWRVAELSEGFNGPLTSEEGIFIALDSIPMILFSLSLTVLHPSIWFSGGYDVNKDPSFHSSWHTEGPRYIALLQKKRGW